MPRDSATNLTLPARRGALVFATLVGAGSLLLVAFGVADLVPGPNLLAALVTAAGLYGLWQIAQTPLALRVDAGQLSVRGLRRRRLPLAELAHVELRRQGMLRPTVLRFVREGGRVAFSADAAVWRPAALQEALHSLGVPLVRPGEAPPAAR
ncbi:MAG: hypothetical protein WAM30_17895, partial [Candidatus Dormiibacterota bacterium]